MSNRLGCQRDVRRRLLPAVAALLLCLAVVEVANSLASSHTTLFEVFAWLNRLRGCRLAPDRSNDDQLLTRGNSGVADTAAVECVEDTLRSVADTHTRAPRRRRRSAIEYDIACSRSISSASCRRRRRALDSIEHSRACDQSHLHSRISAVVWFVLSCSSQAKSIPDQSNKQSSWASCRCRCNLRLRYFGVYDPSATASRCTRTVEVNSSCLLLVYVEASGNRERYRMVEVSRTASGTS